MSEQRLSLPRMTPEQQSSLVRPPPRSEQPEPPHVRQAATQHTTSDRIAVLVWTPGRPLEHVVEIGARVGGEVSITGGEWNFVESRTENEREGRRSGT